METSEKQNIGVVGLGKLGLPVAVAIDSKGHQVTGYDVSRAPSDYLYNREIPYEEAGLQPLLDEHRIKTTESLDVLVTDSDLIFVPVQTPHDKEYEGTTRIPGDRKDFYYEFLKGAVQDISETAEALGKTVTLAVISTCLPGTFEREIRPLLNNNVRYVYTPQFIAMGTVLEDYLNPEFNLIGVEDEEAADQLERFYETINDAPHVRTDITTAEAIKVSYNTWITAKTVIANAWGEMSELMGMNFDDIKKAWDYSTKRIHSPRYTDSGMSDGGGCHPRDNIALSWLANEIGMSHNIWEDLMAAREDFEEWHADLAQEYSTVTELPLVILGRSFKPETNIETGSPAVLVSNLLNERGFEHEHVEDYEGSTASVFFIGTKHERYKDFKFPSGSLVIDPFRYIPRQYGITLVPLGGKL